MKLLNDTPFATHVSRDFHSDNWMIVDATSLVVVDASGAPVRKSFLFRKNREGTRPSHLLSGLRPELLELTVTGQFRAWDAKPFTSLAWQLHVGGEAQAIQVSGPRTWRRVGWDWTATQPSPVEAVESEWRHAFGGSKIRPPSLLPGGGRIPAPSHVLAWPQNPGGVGYWCGEEDAEGRPLPQLEHPGHLMRAPREMPPAYCWAALPEDSSLRLAHFAERDGQLASIHETDGSPITRLTCVAPPWLRVEAEQVHPGLTVELKLDARSYLGFRVPERPPVLWQVETAGRSITKAPRLCRVEFDLDQRTAECLYHVTLACPLISGSPRVFRQVAA